MTAQQPTPMMEQYLSIKQHYQDYLLFYRMGDFYELFFDDAVNSADELEVVLTKRGNHKGAPIPMCGVPVHALELYVGKLISKGYSIAICEQTQTPEEAKKLGQKGPLKRSVTRVITPGTLTQEGLLEQKKANFLLCIGPIKGDLVGVCYCDISTGDLFAKTVQADDISDVCDSVHASEILVCDSWYQTHDVARLFGKHKNLASLLFSPDAGRRRLQNFFNVSDIETLAPLSKEEIGVCAALCEYLVMTHNDGCHIKGITSLTATPFLKMDESTRRSLELFKTPHGYKGSFLWAIDETLTPMGGRLLQRRMLHPFINKDDINSALNDVSHLYDNQGLCEKIRSTLTKMGDSERLYCRILSGRHNPRDVGFFGEFLDKWQDLVTLNLFESQPGLITLSQKLAFLCDDLPVRLTQDTLLFKKGFDKERDHCFDIVNNFETKLQNLEDTYRTSTGIPNLKIRNNNIVGTFIDISTSHVHKVPDTFLHKQTLSTGRRYTTHELNALVEELDTAKQTLQTKEHKLFVGLCNEISSHKLVVLDIIKRIAHLDLIQGFATLAKKHSYVRPDITDTSVCDIEKGRHPSIEKNGTPFVANDCVLDEHKRFILLTGPNMGGKSTFLRQNALIMLLAHMGAFVPAKRATIGLCDAIFTRIGAHDDVVKGMSTFMMEMTESARILNHATNKSFVILDEIGRGTSTYDGLAIAWAMSEYLHEKECRVMFATHYHELTTLEQSLSKLTCMKVNVLEENNNLVFLYSIEKGHTKHSYGISIAKRAGFPTEVVLRAQNILEKEISCSMGFIQKL